MPGYVLGATELVLEDVLVSYVSTWLEEDLLKVRDLAADSSNANPGQVRMGPPTVHAGMLPKNEVGQILVDNIPTYPFVLIHITKGKDMMPEGCVYTKIVVGVWDNNQDCQGYRDAIYVLRKIIRSIWYWNTLADNYQINMEEGTEWRVYDVNESSFPFFFAEAIVGWRLRTPYMKAESDNLDVFPDPNLPPINRGYPAEGTTKEITI